MTIRWPYPVVAGLSIFAVTACAVPLGTYTKAAGTQGELNRDSYECERDMRYLPPQEKSHWWFGDAAAAFYERCMRGKGYSKVE